MKVKYALLAITSALTTVMPAYANPNDSYESWINADVMMTDHQAYCTDIVDHDTTVDKGSTTQANKGSNRQDNHGSVSSSSESSYSLADKQAKESQENTSVGIMSLVNVGKSESSKSSDSSQESGSAKRASERTWGRDRVSTWDQSRSSTWEKTTVTSVVAGKNCDVLLQTAAERDINHDQQLTNRMAIEAKERVKMEEMKTQSQMSLFENLMQGW